MGLRLELSSQLHLGASTFSPPTATDPTTTAPASDAPSVAASTSKLAASLSVNLTLVNITSAHLALRVRVPGWAVAGQSTVSVVRRGVGAAATPLNSAATPTAGPLVPGTLHMVAAPTGGWRTGDRVSLSFAMAPRLAHLRDDRTAFANTSAIMLGPLVLAGVTNESNLLVADPSRVAEWVVWRAARGACHFDGADEATAAARRSAASRRRTDAVPAAAARHTPWQLWDQKEAGCTELVALGANREYRLLPLARVALENYTVYYNVTMHP